MAPTVGKTDGSSIVPFLSEKNTNGSAKNVRQEHLDRLMKSFEDDFPGFYEAIAELRRKNASGPTNL